MTTTSYAVTGLSCHYCMAEMMEQVRALAGVTGVAVDLVTDGPSAVLVTAGPGAVVGQLEETLGEAGFGLAGGWPGRRHGGVPALGGPHGSSKTSSNTNLGGVSS